MISAEDSYYTYEYPGYYKIVSHLDHIQKSKKNKTFGKKVVEGFVYASNTNSLWMKESELQEWIMKNKKKIEHF
jgi:FlaA1/EpsC-like NDP-sugar epimerase